MDIPLILLPGTLCDARLWAAQVTGLSSERTVQVGDLTRDRSIAAMAARVLAVAPPRFALAGLSLGGIVALEIVRRAPQRVERLALLSTTARPPSAGQVEQWRLFATLARAGRLDEVVREQLLPKLVSASRLHCPQITTTVAAMAEAVGPDAYLRQLAALETRIDSRPQLGQIACPTLVLAGEADVICPPELHAELAVGIPEAQFMRLPDCGHLSALEQPARVTEVLSAWLAAGLEAPHGQ
ncbi:MAG TPA: alpha/beta fold hydrolase [Roseiflexaceae bacterium]|nr:alpha/beta fold hydrolase [Roseiflexaceae bacterium]